MKEANLGSALEAARLAKGLSREWLARELNLTVQVLEAIEEERWEQLQEGQQRPLARQLAERLGVDPAQHPASWERIPGGLDPEALDPKRERAERIVMGLLVLGSAALLLWLLVPGPRIPTGGPARNTVNPLPIHSRPPVPAASQPFPVLGEVLPEAPKTADGVLVSLRALDSCEVRLTSEAGEERRLLQVSEPWRLRVKGSFTLYFQNAGVVKLEVAGRPVPHNQAVGEPWSGTFDAEGRLLLAPREPAAAVPGLPEAEAQAEEKGNPR